MIRGALHFLNISIHYKQKVSARQTFGQKVVRNFIRRIFKKWIFLAENRKKISEFQQKKGLKTENSYFFKI